MGGRASPRTSWRTSWNGGLFTCLPAEAIEEVLDAERPLRIKLGIDATRHRLHLGHLVVLRLARALQRRGHHLDLVLGTLTGRLGDPSGRDRTRPVLDEEEVEANAAGLLAGARQVLEPGFAWHLNHQFTEDMDIPTFLTRLAARTTVAHVLSRDGFRRRVEEGRPIALHELLVPGLQAWDSVVLRTEVEVGGTDQLFNFQLARQLMAAEGLAPQRVLMVPILPGTDGRKMSKSLGNCVWLDAAPADVFGQVMSASDEVMEAWWPWVADAPDPGGHPMERKLALAGDVVRQVQGEEGVGVGRAHFERTVRSGRAPADLPVLEAEPLLPLIRRARGCSGNAARALLRDGAVEVDGVKARDPDLVPASGARVRMGRTWIRVE